MADKELSSESKPISTQQEDVKNQNPLFSLLNNFQFNFPQFNKQTKEVPKEVPAKVEVESKQQKVDFVRVPDGKKEFPKLTMEGDESQDASGPRNMWQVYALGGFMIARWLWARWNERKADKDKSDECKSGDDESASANS